MIVHKNWTTCPGMWHISVMDTLWMSHLRFSQSCRFLSVPSEHLPRSWHQRQSRSALLALFLGVARQVEQSFWGRDPFKIYHIVERQQSIIPYAYCRFPRRWIRWLSRSLFACPSCSVYDIHRLSSVGQLQVFGQYFSSGLQNLEQWRWWQRNWHSQ